MSNFKSPSINTHYYIDKLIIILRNFIIQIHLISLLPPGGHIWELHTPIVKIGRLTLRVLNRWFNGQELHGMSKTEL